MYPISETAGRVPKDATPWAHRMLNMPGLLLVLIRVLKMPIKLLNGENIGMHCTLFHGGVYLNFIMDEGQPRIEASYKDHYKRLTGIKQKYDPNNL
jgi:hypothetical protein